MRDSWKPNLFVPAFPKCGTTALCDYLAQHPDIYVTEDKEPRTLVMQDDFASNFLKNYPYWDRLKKMIDRASPSFEEYKHRFEKYADKKYKVDGSQIYSDKEDNIIVIKDFNPSAKILIMIRSPRNRLISFYYYDYRYHKYDFNQYINNLVRPNIDYLLFFKRIAMFIKLFGEDNVRVIDNKALLKEPNLIMNKVFDFLKLCRIDIEPILSNPTISGPLLLRMNNLISDLSYRTTNILEKRGLLDTKLYSTLGKISKTVKTVLKSIEKNRDKSNYYKLLILIPDDVAEILDNDYKRTIDYCSTKGILIR
ncbi:MAG: hypothetical protein KatS3mg003_1176 [Candidatus Nitrosocaldaceae archaeon]|nr:MAG: hypothetical protein KatS3mg003_1176 [Candidatus Nitrosocaldaceae archaeon]